MEWVRKKMWRGREKLLVSIFIILSLLVFLLLSAGCSSQEEEVVGIGSGIDELKGSVCPCGEVFYRNGIWLS